MTDPRQAAPATIPHIAPVLLISWVLDYVERQIVRLRHDASKVGPDYELGLSSARDMVAVIDDEALARELLVSGLVAPDVQGEPSPQEGEQIEGWVARDVNDLLWFFRGAPTLSTGPSAQWGGRDSTLIANLSREEFPGVRPGKKVRAVLRLSAPLVVDEKGEAK